MNSTSVSKRENQLIQEIKDRDMLFFGPREASRFLKIEKRNAYNLLARMKDKKLVQTVQKGRYILTEDLNAHDIYELASNLERQSYIGFFSALHFHSLTDQVPQRIQVAYTKRKKDLEIQGREIHFVKIQQKDFFGYKDYAGTVCSTPEKTITDCLKLPRKAGGIQNIYDAINSDLNSEKLVEYSTKVESSAVASRLGYILEKKNINFNKEKLKEQINNYSKLDPRNERKNPVKEWKIYANRELE